MRRESYFRGVFAALLLTSIAMSSYFRRKARQEGQPIARIQEPPRLIALRVLIGVPLWLAAFLYPLRPRAMAWAQLSLLTWLRSLGVAIGAASTYLLFRMFSDLGSNISETVLTREQQQLVTHGIYRWVRHPLYSIGLSLFAAFSLIAANWLIAGLALLMLVLLKRDVIPREEQALRERFGEQYDSYREQTGQLLPRWSTSKDFLQKAVSARLAP